jgi:hypothetical protein
MKNILNYFKILVSCIIATILISCNSGNTSYSIGGTVSGLTGSNQTLTLVNNGATSGAVIVASGSNSIPFTFSNNVPTGGNYNVTVYAQPSNMSCTVTNGSGMNITANVTNIVVSCTTNTYPVTVSLASGTVLTTSQFVTLVNNVAYGSPVILGGGAVNTATFNVANNATYNVQILSQPIGQTCMVMNGTGVINNAPVTNVQVMCSTTNLSIGGTIYGLSSGQIVTLGLMGVTGGTTFNESGPFTLNESIPYNSPMYSVYVESTTPSNIICTVSNGMGAYPINPVNNINVMCSTTTTPINVAISGLNSGGVISLLNNGNPNGFIESAPGSYNNAFNVATGSTYNITVAGQPIGQTCTINNGQGTATSTTAITVNVICSNNTFPINVTISGLTSGNTVTLINNGNFGQAFIESTESTYNNAFAVAAGSNYNVTIVNQPSTQTCTVNNGQGIMINAQVSVFVICSNSTYTVGGTILGLNTGEILVLNMFGSPSGTIINGVESGAPESFALTQTVAAGGSYNVAVAVQPATGKICTPYNNTGVNISSNINNVIVICGSPESGNTNTINVTYSGLNTGNSVALINNGNFAQGFILTSTTTESAPAFTVAKGSSYNVTIATQPVGQTCTVNNGQGVNINSTVTFNVVCSNTSYTIGGTITGLTSGQTVTFAALGGSNATSVVGTSSESIPFTLNGTVSNTGNYNVIIASQPSAETCTVNNPTGTITNANINNISVTCSSNPVNVNITVAGLTAGNSVTLYNNANYANAFVANANRAYNGAFVLAPSANYNITVASQPAGQTCTVANESGIVPSVGPIALTATCI